MMKNFMIKYGQKNIVEKLNTKWVGKSVCFYDVISSTNVSALISSTEVVVLSLVPDAKTYNGTDDARMQIKSTIIFKFFLIIFCILTIPFY